ncbi:MAG: hypothetical protein H7Z19_22545 [Chitinophagaceae bacterium]|nr:hypothetical protein [Rubrivivax sp.]
MWKKLAFFLITSGAAAKVWRAWQQRSHQHPNPYRKGGHAASVQRWEEEGGAPMVTPSAGSGQGDVRPLAMQRRSTEEAH